MRQRARSSLGDQDRAWAGRGGHGTHCIACGEQIAPADVEFEVELLSGGPALRLHRVCYAIWREECEPQPAG